MLQPSFVIDGSEPEDVTFTLGGRITFMDVWGEHSELRTDFQFGDTCGLQAQLYKPFYTQSHWFFERFAGGSQTTFNNPRADYRIDRVLGGANVGYTFNRFNHFTSATESATSKPPCAWVSRNSLPKPGALAQMSYVRDHTTSR